MLLEYRVTPIPSLGVALCQLLMGRLLRTAMPLSTNKLVPKIESGIFKKLYHNKLKYKKYYDKNAKVREGFNIGQRVVI